MPFQSVFLMSRGIFISFEGSEGCGKSTQIERLHRRLVDLGQRCSLTREPGGTLLGESIRHLLKFAPEGENMVSEAELLLFAASRAQLVREVLRPGLDSGTHFLADRFLDSTVVYQGIGRGLSLETIDLINRLAVGDCLPDITFVLDMDAKLALDRARDQTQADLFQDQVDRMESEQLTFYENVRQGYLDLANRESGRFVVIDASLPIPAIETLIWTTLTERYDGFSLC